MMNGFGGLFGAPAMWGATKPYQNDAFKGMGMAQQPPAPEIPKEKKPSNTLGIIADALLGLGGQQGVFGPMMMRRREQDEYYKRQQQMFEQQRQAGLQDYAAKLGIKAQFEVPEPPKPGSFEWWQTATPEQRAEYDRFNPIVRMTPWSGTEFIGRTGQTGQQGGFSLDDIDAELARRGVK